MDWIAQKIRRYNAPFARCQNDGVRVPGAPFCCIEGSIPVLLSAPHAVGQYHGAARKAADAFTGGLLKYLCRRTGAYGIVRVYNAGDNPNADAAGYGLQYRQQAAELMLRGGLRYLIDLHGCSDEHGFALELGTGCGQTVGGDGALVQRVLGQLQPLGIVSCDQKFCASRPTTVSWDVHARTSAACMQLELSHTLRTRRLGQTAQVLEQLIWMLAQEAED